MGQPPVQTDDSHPHPLQRLGGEIMHWLLAGGARLGLADVRLRGIAVGRGYRRDCVGDAGDGYTNSSQGRSLEKVTTGQV